MNAKLVKLVLELIRFSLSMLIVFGATLLEVAMLVRITNPIMGLLLSFGLFVITFYLAGSLYKVKL